MSENNDLGVGAADVAQVGQSFAVLAYLQGKQTPFEGQVASAAPSTTCAEPPRGEALGQGEGSLAAERNTGGSPPTPAALTTETAHTPSIPE